MQINIDPKNLKELRLRKKLSRAQLAEKSNVSERQITRIESSKAGVTARIYTVNRLADALNVDCKALSGASPLPNDQQEAIETFDQRINPKRLKDLRTRKKLSRRQLAEKANLSERQIARIESSERDVSVRTSTVKRLAFVLGIDKEILAGAKPSDPSQPLPSQDVQFGFKISPEVRLAYDLVKYRYGPSYKDMINLAPLLFVLLAEGSLAWRRQLLDETTEAMESLRTFANTRKHLYFAHHLTDVEAGGWAEDESIDSADLRGDSLRNRDDNNLDFAGEALYEVTPFADYLWKLSEDLELAGKVDFGSGIFDDLWGAEPYQVCGNELREITGGSKCAKWALQYGDVRLSDIPNELMSEESKDRRIEWLESRLSDQTREIMEIHEKLLASINVEDEQ